MKIIKFWFFINILINKSQLPSYLAKESKIWNWIRYPYHSKRWKLYALHSKYFFDKIAL